MSRTPLNIIIESKVPYLRGVLEPYARVRYLAPEDITPEAVRDADALIVRTRTRCDSGLLGGSRVSFVGTATIGTDHIDLDWCEARGISVVNAPGCNAPAVAQYVLGSVLSLADRPLAEYTLGVVGVGHVGSIVARWARGLCMSVLECDPPRASAEGGDFWVSAEEIARRADIITFHTPLTSETRHMADARFFDLCRRAPIVLHSARGPVVDTRALIEALEQGRVSRAVIDCWEDEPEISTRLLDLVSVGTPHIAGYSAEGKLRASQAVLDALTRHFGLPTLRADAPLDAPEPPATVSAEDVRASFDPAPLTRALKASPGTFETQRNSYPLRHEVLG